MKIRFLSVFTFVLFSLVFLMDSHAAYAQAKLKVAVVNIDGIRTRSKAFATANEQLLKIKDQINASLLAEEKVLREANAELSRKRTLLAPETFSKERKEYEKRVTDYQRKRQKSQIVMNKKLTEAMSKLNKKIIDIIQKYAEDNQITLILPQSQVIFSAEQYNISSYVLGVLNKKMPSIAVSLPAQ